MVGANIIETHGASQNSRSEQAVSGMKWRLRCSRARDQQRGKFGEAASRVALDNEMRPTATQSLFCANFLLATLLSSFYDKGTAGKYLCSRKA